MRKSITIALGILMLACGLARADSVVLPLPPEDQQKIAAKLGPGVVTKALPSKAIQDVSVYFPLQGHALTYQVTAGPNTGKNANAGAREGQALEREAGLAVSVIAVTGGLHPSDPRR